jgi:hypothetical protein
MRSCIFVPLKLQPPIYPLDFAFLSKRFLDLGIFWYTHAIGQLTGLGTCSGKYCLWIKCKSSKEKLLYDGKREYRLTSGRVLQEWEI